VPQVHRLRLVTDATASPLCRTASQACIACCRGSRMSRERLSRLLHRQTLQFGLTIGIRVKLPSRLVLIAHELRARRGWPVLLGPLFLLPGVGPLLREWLGQRMCCTFLGYPDDDESRPGCLLHPSHWAGVEVRRQVAFAMLPGMTCGEPGHVCQSAALYQNAGITPRRRFRDQTRDMHWFDYSRSVEECWPELTTDPASR
jgi:hypothetical protein